MAQRRKKYDDRNPTGTRLYADKDATSPLCRLRDTEDLVRQRALALGYGWGRP